MSCVGPLQCSASEDEGGVDGATQSGALGLSARSRTEALAILRGLQAPGEQGSEGAEGLATKGIFALPFMQVGKGACGTGTSEGLYQMA